MSPWSLSCYCIWGRRRKVRAAGSSNLSCSEHTAELVRPWILAFVGTRTLSYFEHMATALNLYAHMAPALNLYAHMATVLNLSVHMALL